MKAFENTPVTKEQLLTQLRGHHAADEIIQGRYWENGKGCAVGCSIHGRDHYQYEKLFGIPYGMALLEDRIFERLPPKLAKEWPLRFSEAVPVGADLNPVLNRFGVWMMQTGLCVSDDPKVKALGEALVEVFKSDSPQALARALDLALALALDRVIEVSDKLLEFIRKAK
jgi:hypothetical protein